MLNNLKHYLGLIAGILLFVTSCSSDDPVPLGPEPTGNSKEYTLSPQPGSIISGTATFIENNDESTTIEMSLIVPQSVGMYPAHIHFNSAAEGGPIAVALAEVDGSTGKSSITLSALDNGTIITYEDFLNFDGHVNVHLSATELSTIVAQGDFGQNELTGNTQIYALTETGASGISGTFTLEERVNGTTLATIDLSGISTTGTMPAHIHSGDIASGGDIAITLSSVDNSTGIGQTQISQLNDGSAITYNELLSFDGHVKVHASPTDLETIVAQAELGINAGGETVTYNVTNSGSSAYVFNGNGLVDASNPALTLVKGKTYIFNVNAQFHPFFIKTAQGTGSGSLYTSGITNNGATVGTITFVVPSDAPTNLFYNCEFHAAMANSITITE